MALGIALAVPVNNPLCKNTSKAENKPNKHFCLLSRKLKSKQLNRFGLFADYVLSLSCSELFSDIFSKAL